MNNKFSFPTSRNKIRKQVLSYFKSNNLYQNSCHNQIQLQSFQLKNKIQQRKLKSTANPFTHYPPTAQHLYNPTTMKGNTRSLSAQKAEFRKMVRTWSTWCEVTYVSEDAVKLSRLWADLCRLVRVSRAQYRDMGLPVQNSSQSQGLTCEGLKPSYYLSPFFTASFHL